MCVCACPRLVIARTTQHTQTHAQVNSLSIVVLDIGLDSATFRRHTKHRLHSLPFMYIYSVHRFKKLLSRTTCRVCVCASVHLMKTHTNARTRRPRVLGEAPAHSNRSRFQRQGHVPGCALANVDESIPLTRSGRHYGIQAGRRPTTPVVRHHRRRPRACFVVQNTRACCGCLTTLARAHTLTQMPSTLERRGPAAPKMCAVCFLFWMSRRVVHTHANTHTRSWYFRAAII